MEPIPILPVIKQAEFITNLFDRAMAGVPILDGPEGDRDLDVLCGYPSVITDVEYMQMYRRNEIANRVVNLEPDECWKEHPKIYETEEERETPFEKAVDKFIANSKLFAYLHRLDRMSGIGRYGALFIGVNDGIDFHLPAPGYTDDGLAPTRGNAEVMYMRVFSEVSMSISEFERDPFKARYGQPKLYNLMFQDSSGEAEVSATQVLVHWSRVIHVFDNPVESEVYGMPRMEAVYNRLLDLRKVVGGSGEMYWKGAFPGLAFEVDPKVGEFTEDEKTALREDVRAYAEGLQRYITMVGVKVNSIAPQIADPTAHTNNILKLIAMNKGIPMQTFMGSQQGQLDSPQDTILWRERIALRKERHVSPNIIRPTLDRLIQYGALPEPTEQLDQPLPYIVKWEPMAPLSIIEQAEVAKSLAEALARYSTSGSEALIPLPEFLGKVMGFSAQMVEAIMAADKTKFSVVFQEMAGITGTSGGNTPSSIPKVPKPGNKKDPSKTPVNVQQRAKR